MIDLRSDTVTRPTEAMYQRMRQACLGDDGLDGDPTAFELESVAAALLQKEAGLFVASGTMANLLAVMVHARGGDCFLEERAHIALAEAESCALAGCRLHPIPGQAGAMDLDALDRSLSRGVDKARLISVETSHNDAGGAVLSLEHLSAVQNLANSRDVSVHLDGARLFNACVYLGVEPEVVTATCHSATFCLSKGLSAPVGAVLVGDRAFIEKARRLRKHLGGQQRQVGVVAAAGLEALATMRDRLAEDHRRARRLASGLVALDGTLSASDPQTNIVLIDVGRTSWPAETWVGRLESAGVRVRARPNDRLRCVLHRHIADHDVDWVIETFARVAAAADGSPGCRPDVPITP